MKRTREYGMISVLIVMLLVSSFFIGIGTKIDPEITRPSVSKSNSNSRGQGPGNANWTLLSNITMGMYSGIDVGLDSKPDLGDLDDDGDLDLIVGENDGTVNYFKNTGGPLNASWAAPVKMQSGGVNINVGSPCTPTLADLDNDGDLDMVIGEGFGEMSFYNNTGNESTPKWITWGKLNRSGVKIKKGGWCSPAFADLDDDGDLDLTFGDWTKNLYYYVNNGTAESPIWDENTTLYKGITLHPGSIRLVPKFGDMDDDGDLDLVVGDDWGWVFYFENTGDPTTPNWTKNTTMFDGVKVDEFAGPALGDLDNDGDIDLTLGERNGTLVLYDNEMIMIDRIRLFLRLENGDGPKGKTCYSKYKPYIFKVSARSSFGVGDIKKVKMILDNEGERLEYVWTNESRNFTEVRDPNDYAEILSTSMNGTNDSIRMWTFKFKLMFNWSYPDEMNHTVRIYCKGYSPLSAWYNRSSVYRVENDLDFFGNLSVDAEHQGELSSGDWVRKGESINWSGIKVVYQNTTDKHPPDSEFNVTLRDDDGDTWVNTSSSGENISIKSTADTTTDDNDTHFFNITEIPSYCDASNLTFVLKIDGENVSFSDPTPDPEQWQTVLTPICGINITDVGGTEVNASSVEYSTSTDNGTTWSNWENGGEVDDASSISAGATPTLLNGRDNLIKWRALDVPGNGYNVSDENRIIIDVENATFHDPFPDPSLILNDTTVEFGITIMDELSGVDADSIEYMYSTDNRTTWSNWITAGMTNDTGSVNTSISRTMENGTGNYIKWRVTDVAGNGPTESDEYQIKIDTSVPVIPNVAPEVTLIAPADNGTVTSEFPVLSWNCTDPDDLEIYYYVYLGTDESKVMGRISSMLVSSEQTSTSYTHTAPLPDGSTYYWTVIPNDGAVDGTCLSGVWAFKIDLAEEIPAITLSKPLDNGIVNDSSVQLEWNVMYNGTDPITYDVYLDTAENPSTLYSENLSSNSVTVDDLDDGTTYYWKVAVNVGNERAVVVSEIRSFEIDLDFVPIYGVDLFLEKSELSMERGDVMNLSLTITNLGNTVDEIVLSLNPGTLGDDVTLEGGGTPMVIGANDSFIGKLTLKVGAERYFGNHTVKISARSVGDTSGNTMVERTLIVTVLKSGEDDDTDDDDDDDDDDADDDDDDDNDDDNLDDDTDDGETTDEKSFLEGSFFIVLMVFLSLVMLVIVLLLVMRRRKKDKPDVEPAETEGSETGGEELPVMELKEPDAEDTGSDTPEIVEEPDQITAGELVEYDIIGSSGPECGKCGGISGYYEEYDCYWCDACQDYVYGEETTGGEISEEGPLTEDSEISFETDISTDEGEGDVIEPEVDASEHRGDESTTEDGTEDESTTENENEGATEDETTAENGVEAATEVMDMQEQVSEPSTTENTHKEE